MIIENNGSAIVSGKLGRDAEMKTIQKKDGSGSFSALSFSIVYGRKADGQNMYIDVQVMFERAQYFAHLKKGDAVFCAGPIRTREYQGKTYRTLDAEFVAQETHDGTEVAQQGSLLDDLVSSDIPF